MLTQDDVKTLTGYFEASEHEFLRGNAYIREWAICDRIEQVDPAWSFEVVEITRQSPVVEGGQSIVYVKGRMTVKGAIRENVGMADVQMMNNKVDSKTGEILEQRDHLEANEAEKAATTDALKRCARLFGVGRYLLKLPDNVRDDRTMAAWINKQTGKVTSINHTVNTPLASGQPRRIDTPPAGTVEKGLLATKIEYKASGNNKFLVFPDAKNAPVLYTREPLRKLGESWSDWADKLQPGKADLPTFVLLTTEAKVHQDTGDIYHVVTDVELAGGAS